MRTRQPASLGFRAPLKLSKRLTNVSYAKHSAVMYHAQASRSACDHYPRALIGCPVTSPMAMEPPREEDPAQCRYCLQEVLPGLAGVLKPCGCAGTMAYVHSR